MKLRPPQAYHLELFDEGPYRLFLNGAQCKFSKPASTRQHPKLKIAKSVISLLLLSWANNSSTSAASIPWDEQSHLVAMGSLDRNPIRSIFVDPAYQRKDIGSTDGDY